jgi:hypothetical protein
MVNPDIDDIAKSLRKEGDNQPMKRRRNRPIKTPRKSVTCKKESLQLTAEKDSNPSNQPFVKPLDHNSTDSNSHVTNIESNEDSIMKETQIEVIWSKHNRKIDMDICILSMPVEMEISSITQQNIGKLLEEEYKKNIQRKNMEKLKKEFNEEIKKGYAPAMAEPKLYQYARDYGYELSIKYGSDCEPLLEPKIPKAKVRRDWNKISPHDKVLTNRFHQVTQAIMCRQEKDLDDNDYYLWATKVIPKEELGNMNHMSIIDDDSDEEWIVSSKQEEMINDAKNDARRWYHSQSLETRLKRLNKDTYAAHCVRRWAHGRAEWPKNYVGPKPSNMQEWQTALRIIYYIKWNEPLKPALEEYREWWINQRNKREPDVRILGDEIYSKTQKLYIKLHKERLHKNTVEQLQLYAAQIPVDWPFLNEGISLPSESIVQLDTLSEWIQSVQFNQKWQTSYRMNGYLEAWDTFNQNKETSQWEKLLLPIHHFD